MRWTPSFVSLLLIVENDSKGPVIAPCNVLRGRRGGDRGDAFLLVYPARGNGRSAAPVADDQQDLVVFGDSTRDLLGLFHVVFVIEDQGLDRLPVYAPGRVDLVQEHIDDIDRLFAMAPPRAGHGRRDRDIQVAIPVVPVSSRRLAVEEHERADEARQIVMING